MTLCFFLFGASSHPYIPLHFEEIIFPLVYEHANPSAERTHYYRYTCVCATHLVRDTMYMFRDRWQVCTTVYNHLLILSLLWSLVEVHSHTLPRPSFMGQTLSNHSYVNISQVGRPDQILVVVMMFSVLLTWPHVVLMVLIMETGIS